MDFDGSWHAGTAGVGFTIHGADDTLVVAAGFPVMAADACRAEMLSVMAATVCALLYAPLSLEFYGDNLFVVSVLQRKFLPHPTDLYLSANVLLDLLASVQYVAEW